MWEWAKLAWPELMILDALATPFAVGPGVPPELGEALAALTARIEADRSNVEAWFLRGAVLQGLGRPAEALGDLREAVRRQPGHARAWLLISEVLPVLGAPEKARAARERALLLDPAVAR